MKKSFNGIFMLSCDDYLKSNNLTGVTEHNITKWREDTINAFRNDVPDTVLISTFRIPETYADIISRRKFEISDSGYQLDGGCATDDITKLAIFMTLTIDV